MSYSAFKETDNRLSAFIKFSENKGFLVEESTSGDDGEAKAKPAIPQLSYLRVELDRLRPGMADYVIRVSTPLYEGVEKTNTVISIRGNRSLAKYESVKKLANVIAQEMLDREDSTHSWDNCDVEHLADLLANFLKFFSITTNADRLQFTTEALA